MIDKNSPYQFTKDDTLIYAAGSKARDVFKAKGFTIERDYSDDMEKTNVKINTENTHINGNLHDIIVEDAELHAHLKNLEYC